MFTLDIPDRYDNIIGVLTIHLTLHDLGTIMVLDDYFSNEVCFVLIPTWLPEPG